MPLTLAALWLLSHTLAAVHAGSTLIVQVGILGNSYSPDQILALRGDTVQFFFFSVSNHSVVQTTFENPCVPLKGGFNSGMFGSPTVDLLVPVWDLIITNDREPIWFYCEGSIPRSHCAEGMVGVINLPAASSSMFSAFTAAAKAVKGTPSPVPSITLTGVGAFATAPPRGTRLSSATLSSSPITTPTAPSVAPPTLPTPASHNSNHVSAITGSVCGTIGGVLALLCVFTWHRRRSRRKSRVIFSMLDISGSLYKGTHSAGGYNIGEVDGDGDIGRISPMKLGRTVHHPIPPTIPQPAYEYHGKSTGQNTASLPAPASAWL
ncbi:hypothetical protein AMATHDRAFT_63498 [Amanita thiersii Skay4041]|uniref:Cupredoxin n=1 Tax=Amanita thiersii Skay4041 TaxID=703135 RepID=A0A2A9NNI7_9AGAR|nr:hypothetical protein AMATHDRAFT_63498 [Amanita thiersii Skay4041]